MNGAEMYDHLKQLLETNNLPIPGIVEPTNCGKPYYVAMRNRVDGTASDIVVTILGKNMLGDLKKSDEIVINLAQERMKLADHINKWLLMGKESNRMHAAKVEVDFTLQELPPQRFYILDISGWFTY